MNSRRVVTSLHPFTHVLEREGVCHIANRMQASSSPFAICFPNLYRKDSKNIQPKHSFPCADCGMTCNFSFPIDDGPNVVSGFEMPLLIRGSMGAARPILENVRSLLWHTHVASSVLLAFAGTIVNTAQQQPFAFVVRLVSRRLSSSLTTLTPLRWDGATRMTRGPRLLWLPQSQTHGLAFCLRSILFIAMISYKTFHMFHEMDGAVYREVRVRVMIEKCFTRVVTPDVRTADLVFRKPMENGLWFEWCIFFEIIVWMPKWESFI